MKKSIIFIITGTVTGIIFILPLLLFGTLNAGNGFGLILSAGLIYCGLFGEKVKAFIKNLWKKVYGKIFISLFLIFALCASLITAVFTVKMIKAANNPPTEETTVIILGCKVKPSGPSLMLTTRLNAAISYLNENPSSVCVLSGGKGADEPMSEAQAMQEWLMARGIEESRLYLEDKSTSTLENILFSREIIEKEGLPVKVTLITNEFHQYRAKTLAGSLGTEAFGVSAKTPLYLLPTYYVRELFGLLAEAFRKIIV